MIRVSKSAQFERDFERAALFLADENPSAASSFINAVDSAIDLLRQFPELGPIWRHGNPQRPVRFFVIPQFRNYLIFYRVESEELRLGRLLHGARDLRDLLND